MNDLDRKKKAKEFATFWKDKGYEKGEAQKYWITLLENVFDVKNINEFIEFEDQVHIDKATGFIDGYIPSTKVLIEQKSIDKDLRKSIKQSDGSLLTPFQQARKYIIDLPVSKHPKWVVTCNFKSFLVYDMDNPNGEPEEILLKNLPKEYYRLSFLVDTKNEHIKKEEELSFKAGELVGKLYDAFLKQYKDINNKQSQKDLNELCVRLVFCLYAEDAGLFGRKNIFHDYLNKYDDLNLMRENLIKLFKILDTPIDERDQYLEDDLNQFPYVNGGLFSNENIEIPTFTEEIKETLLAKASDDFDWSEISPTIFGAVFESTLNPETRRLGGMHYTSIENIHKVIDPLFLNDLREELNKALSYKNEKTRTEALENFQDHLSSLKFLDPACGSGNFLTETFLSLRRLENEAIATMQDGRIRLDVGDIVKVNINQLYGIEINDFAVKVATTALWIAESQMLEETSKLLSKNLEYLPLKTYTNIYEGNALRIDWNDVIPNTDCDYIMGNPPFIGQSVRSKEQSEDMNLIFGKGSIETKLDYVLCWYKKSLEFAYNNKVQFAFVSTNSICQGEAVPTFWKNIISQYNIEIQFAYTPFIWNSEANQKAQVHCVIVGFTNYSTNTEKQLYNNNRIQMTNHINPYLVSAPDIWIENRINKPCNGMPKMTTGSPPTDDGGLLLDENEKKDLILKYPIIEKYIRPFIGAREFLHDNIGTFSRYCLWFKDANPSDFKNIPEIKERLNRVYELRIKSNADRIQKMAAYPYLFCQTRQPMSSYLVIPRHSSGKRSYIPIGYVNPNVIAGDACTIVPNISLYYFGIITSKIHMAWMKMVCGRLKSDYRYSPSVYNNFPWPNPTKEQKEKIERTAQAILHAREKFPNNTLDDLYDDLTMPPDLRKAHQDNDKAVMEAYGFKKNITESNIVAELMKMYQQLVENKK